jgi:uncharacterized protein
MDRKTLRLKEGGNKPTRVGAEIDLILFKDGRHVGVECKRVDAPELTPSMRIALADLKLDQLSVVYPGEKKYSLAKNVDVVPLAKFVKAT